MGGDGRPVHPLIWRRIARSSTPSRQSSKIALCCALPVRIISAVSLYHGSSTGVSFADRLRTIISYDRVLVMDAGMVAVSHIRDAPCGVSGELMAF